MNNANLSYGTMGINSSQWAVPNIAAYIPLPQLGMQAKGQGYAPPATLPMGVAPTPLGGAVATSGALTGRMGLVLAGMFGLGLLAMWKIHWS